MKTLTEIPEAWLTAQMPNLDVVDELPTNLTEADISWMALNNSSLLSERALVAATYALSWRDKLVGATAYAVDAEAGRIGVLNGFNVKPQPGEDGANIHAEQMVIERVRKNGFGHIAFIAVHGEPEIDETTRLMPLSLYPCQQLCEPLMRQAPEIDSTTAIMSLNSDFSICELYGLDDLAAYRADPENLASKTGFQRFNLTPKALENPDYEEAVMFLRLAVWARLNSAAPQAAMITDWVQSGQPLLS